MLTAAAAVLSVLLAFSTVVMARQGISCLPGWYRMNEDSEICYKYLLLPLSDKRDDFRYNYRQAQNACTSLHPRAHLPVVRSEQSNAELHRFVDLVRLHKDWDPALYLNLGNFIYFTTFWAVGFQCVGEDGVWEGTRLPPESRWDESPFKCKGKLPVSEEQGSCFVARHCPCDHLSAAVMTRTSNMTSWTWQRTPCDAQTRLAQRRIICELAMTSETCRRCPPEDVTCLRDTCSCEPGFWGRSCELDVNECHLLSPCAQHATCINNVGSFTCICPRGFTGDLCDRDVDECREQTAPFACRNFRACINTPGSYKCSGGCTQGFTGENCTFNNIGFQLALANFILSVLIIIALSIFAYCYFKKFRRLSANRDVIVKL